MTEAEHHAVFDVSGMWDIAWSESVSKVAPSIGLIRIPSLAQPYVGTGLLIASRFLLTSAHVVESLIDFEHNPPSAIDGSAARVQVEFHHPRVVGRDLQPIVARFDETGWLKTCSPPCGKPPVLNANDDLARSNLDFALIKLATPVGSIIGPISIDAVPPANDNGLVAVAGHLGGPSLKFHLGRLIRHHKRSKRLHHQANAAPGLSGGPCFNIEGAVLGIHEGAVHEGVTAKYNRSVYLKDIRQAIASLNPDPLLDDPNYIAWLPRNLSLDPLNALGISEEEADRQPVVGRRAFQDWMVATSSLQDTQRLALISGAEACGKSLTGMIVKAHADKRGDPYHSVSAEMARKSEIAGMLKNMTASAAGSPPDLVAHAFRPGAGVLRHQIIPDGLSAVENSLKARSGADLAVFWLFIDFGSDQGWSSSEEDDWKSFFGQALEKPWLRIVVSGLSVGRQAEFRALFSQSVALYCETLSPLEWPEIEEFASGMLGTRMAIQAKADMLGKIRAQWQRKTSGVAPLDRMRTTVEILLFLLLKTALES